MSLKTKLSVLGLLYFVQGMPYGFQEKLLPIALRSEGVSYSGVSWMKLLLIPWLCKTFWAPLLDSYQSPRWWLLASMTLLALTCFLGAIFVSLTSLLSLAVLLIAMNTLCATQDIAVDTLAIQILDHAHLGHGNSAQVLGYKAGSLFGGGILVLLQEYYGWAGTCILFGIVYVATTMGAAYVTLLDHLAPPRSTAKEGPVPNAASLVSKDLFASTTTISVVIFILCYKLGERGSLSTFPLFLHDKGVSSAQLAFWNGIVSQLCSMVGSLHGGVITATCSSPERFKLALQYANIARCMAIAVQTLLIAFSSSSELSSVEYYASMISLCSLNYSAGLMTTMTFTWMMCCSKTVIPSAQGTHYTTLATLEVLGKLLFSSMIGGFIDSLGFVPVYGLLVVLTALCALLIRSAKLPEMRKLLEKKLEQ